MSGPCPGCLACHLSWRSSRGLAFLSCSIHKKKRNENHVIVNKPSVSNRTLTTRDKADSADRGPPFPPTHKNGPFGGQVCGAGELFGQIFPQILHTHIALIMRAVLIEHNHPHRGR